MKNISICDISIRRSGEYAGSPLPFRVRIEVAKLLSRLGVNVIETSPVSGKADYFLVKSLCSALSGCTVSVPVDILDPESPKRTWDALSCAQNARLKVPVPVSAVQMEYICHKKPAAILKLISDSVSACASLCRDVEFEAIDFGRADADFFIEAVDSAVRAGATVVTVSDLAGNLLPSEFFELVRNVRSQLPAGVRLGIYCSNDLYLADACAAAAVRAGADEIKTMAFGESTVSLRRFPHILNAKSDACGAMCDVKLIELEHVMAKIDKLCDVTRSKSPVAVGIPSDVQSEVRLSVHDDMAAVMAAVNRLGYELSDEDSAKVYDAFVRLSSADSEIGAKEIDAIVASVAFQVPSTYMLENFVINTGNVITPTCQIRLRKGDRTYDNVSTGDGPVDAAFLAVEKVLGRHYELDDFQVRAVTEGRDSMGETIVRLRHEGKVYSGRGVSKDIVGSSVIAYLNAANRIIYEEEQA